MRRGWSQEALSRTCTGREGIGAVRAEGDNEPVRVEVGESGEEESRLERRDWEWPSKDFGLSFPVGPLPRAGRFAGGKLRACRKQVFSSSSSETLCSRA
jgi:hypothetical protein